MAKKISILGTDVSLVNNQNVISEVLDLLKKKKQIFIATPNPEQIVQAWENKEFQNILNKADLAIPDGVGLVWVLRMNQESRIKNQEARNEKEEKKEKREMKIDRITGVDLMERLCKLCFEKNWKVGLLGGRENTGELTCNSLKRKYIDLEVEYVGSHKNISERNAEEDKEIVQKIKRSGIKVLLVAYGAPYQELLISKYIKLLPDVKIFMGVGGSFDFISGKIKRAPEWMQKYSLEWLFRLIQEPWRWRRQLRLIKFLWLIVRN